MDPDCPAGPASRGLERFGGGAPPRARPPAELCVVLAGRGVDRDEADRAFSRGEGRTGMRLGDVVAPGGGVCDSALRARAALSWLWTVPSICRSCIPSRIASSTCVPSLPRRPARPPSWRAAIACCTASVARPTPPISTSSASACRSRRAIASCNELSCKVASASRMAAATTSSAPRPSHAPLRLEGLG